MTPLIRGRAESITQALEHQLSVRPTQGSFDPNVVLALDIVRHALEFSHTPDALALWREALWHRRLRPEARVAVLEMLEYALEAAARGELTAITNICDCLQQILSDGVFDSSARVGGVQSNTMSGLPEEVAWPERSVRAHISSESSTRS